MLKNSQKGHFATRNGETSWKCVKSLFYEVLSQNGVLARVAHKISWKARKNPILRISKRRSLKNLIKNSERKKQNSQNGVLARVAHEISWKVR